jgi:hypothetical protein
VSSSAGDRTNGRDAGAGNDADEAALDALDAEPLDADEAAAGSAAADEAVDETLAERVAAVIADLDPVERRPGADGVAFAADGSVFAFLGDGRLEAGLDPAIATAALRTADTTRSPRGAGWVVFRPASVDRFALDRAEAWVRSAHRRATG